MANGGELRPHGKSVQRCLCRLFCCSCLQGEEVDLLQEQGREINGGPQPSHMDERPGENEAIQITVEDLGIVNASFSLLQEDPVTQRSSITHSASSVSASPRALRKKRIKPLSSLPIRAQAKPFFISTNWDNDEEEEEGMLLCESGASSRAGSLLAQPVINLIPPTPSDVADDQFFDVNSEEGVTHVSCSDGSFAGGESQEDNVKREEAEKLEEEMSLAENKDGVESAAEPEESQSGQIGEEREALPAEEEDKEQTKPELLRSVYQVAPLPEYPQKNVPNDRDVRRSDVMRADLCLLPYATNMESVTQQRKPITRSHSIGETLTRSATFHALTQTSDQKEEGSSQQRRSTVASFMPQSKDQNGNFPEKDVDKHEAKSLERLNTDEICQWFTRIGLHKCLPFIREAKLCGADMAAVDANTLDTLRITTLEDREQLLSAIYNELHPPTTISRRLNSVLEFPGQNDIDTFTATIATMSKSKSTPHISCLSMNRRSLKLRDNSQNFVVQRNTQLIEITINVSERIVHLRTPKETTVGKVMESCIKMLGVTQDKSLFLMKETQRSTVGLRPDQQIGSLLKSENKQLELHLCKTEKSSNTLSNNAEVPTSDENSNRNVQVSQAAKEERIRELNQQVDSLQNVILQIQELHLDLVAFCSELKSTDGDVTVDGLGSAELRQRLESVKSQLNDKRHSLQGLRDNINNAAAHKKKQLDVRLLEKMKLNCQVFKEEISMVHLNRQVAHLQSALRESCIEEEAPKKSPTIVSLSQLVSLQAPAMLLLVQENIQPSGHYGFTCGYREDGGLVVLKADDSHLCVGDRLVEVNSVPVVNSTLEELTDTLLQGASARIVVLRPPPPALASQQHPVLLAGHDPVQTVTPQRDAVTVETPPQRQLMAI